MANFRTCLRSRKRKLHELYFATVHCTAVESKPSDAVEDQNEASFLDANDITKYVKELFAIYDRPTMTGWWTCYHGR